MDDIKERIRELIDELSVTNKDFADQIGVAPAIISHVLSGRNKASLHLIQQITSVYTNVNIAYLLHGDGSLYTDDNPHSSSNKTTNTPLPSGARYVAPPSGAPIPSTSTPFIPSEEHEKAEPELTNVYTNVNSAKKKSIERIVIFYSDKSFEEYQP